MYTFYYTVCFADIDAAGIVYYPRFFHICHLALEACFNEQSPVGYADLIHKRQLGLPIVSVEATYKSPLRFGDSVYIEYAVERINNSSLVSHYRGFKAEKTSPGDLQANDECFSAHITTVCLDLATKKSIQIPDDLRSFFDSLMKKS